MSRGRRNSVESVASGPAARMARDRRSYPSGHDLPADKSSGGGQGTYPGWRPEAPVRLNRSRSVGDLISRKVVHASVEEVSGWIRVRSTRLVEDLPADLDLEPSVPGEP